MHKGRVVFGAMDEVVFGRPASEAIVEQMDRLGGQARVPDGQRHAKPRNGRDRKYPPRAGLTLRRLLSTRCPRIRRASAVIAATDQARAANADLIVTIGGGSITDGAKAVQLCLANDIRTSRTSKDRARNGVPPPMTAPTMRQISAPTTIAGGDFSPSAGVTNEKTKVKEMVRHRLTMPRAVILDPALGAHTPEWLWLSTGIRAVDHCVEGICSGQSHPYADAQMLKGLSLLAQALPRVKTDGSDLDARMDCQIGTWLSMGGLSSGVPMGASHGIGYVLGAEFGVPHGYTSCVMLPFVMRWNKPVNAERQALVAAAMGHPGEDAADVLDNFIRGLGMPRSLREVKVGSRTFRPDRAGCDGDALGAAQPSQDRGTGTSARNSQFGCMKRSNVQCIPASILIVRPVTAKFPANRAKTRPRVPPCGSLSPNCQSPQRLGPVARAHCHGIVAGNRPL